MFRDAKTYAQEKGQHHLSEAISPPPSENCLSGGEIRKSCSQLLPGRKENEGGRYFGVGKLRLLVFMFVGEICCLTTRIRNFQFYFCQVCVLSRGRKSGL